MTSTHRRIACPALEGPAALRVVEAESRAPGPGEVRLGVRAAAVNFPDLLMTRGLYQAKPSLPFCPGMEVAGVLLEVGEGVDGWRAGDRAIALTGPHHPGFAEEVTLPAALLLPVPTPLSDAEAAALHVAHWTALHALADRGRLKPGETLAVLGAAGGVGLAAVQVAAALGARIAAVARGAGKAAVLRAEGAHLVIDPEREDLRAALKAFGGGGIDVVLDAVGGALFEPAVRALRPEGRHLVVGFAGGGPGVLASNIALIKEIELIGVRAGQFGRRHPGVVAAGHERLAGWIEAGLFRPRIHAVYPLSRAAEALLALESGAVLGKIVVIPD
jgi:NADPH2:quinone reductase